MKNLFKFGFLALAISLSVAACGGSDKKADGAGDSTSVDSAAAEAAASADTAKMEADTAKMAAGNAEKAADTAKAAADTTTKKK